MDQRGKNAIDGKSMHFTGAVSELKNCNSIQVRLGGYGKPAYSPGDIDLLAVVYQDLLWLIPFTEEVRVKTSMCINLTSDKKYGQFKQE